MTRNCILYSTNTELAYRINVEYYDDIHYVYVASNFGSPVMECELFQNPSTSKPSYRYRVLKEEVESRDRHSPFIANNRLGIQKGADEKLKEGIITQDKRDEIYAIVNMAEQSDFQPLLYLMAFSDVEHLLVRIPPSQKAHPLSDEWIIKELPGELFEVIRY